VRNRRYKKAFPAPVRRRGARRRAPALRHSSLVEGTRLENARPTQVRASGRRPRPLETMPGTTHPWRSSGGDEGCRCASVLGGGALGRARRVFYEDKRRSNEPHLGPDTPLARRGSSGAVLLHELSAARTRDVGKEKTRRWLARLRKRSRSAAREALFGSSCFSEQRARGERDARGSGHASVLLGR